MAVQAVNQKAGEREEDERSGRLGNRKGDAASMVQNTPKSSDPSQDCSSATHQSPPLSTLFSLPPPCRPAPAAPQGATLSGICVELAASLRLVFSPLAGRI